MTRSEKNPIGPSLQEEYLELLFCKQSDGGPEGAQNPHSDGASGSDPDGKAGRDFIARLLKTTYGHDPTRFWKLNSQVQDRLGEEGRIKALACWAGWLRAKDREKSAEAPDADEMVLRLAGGADAASCADGRGVFQKRLAQVFGLDHVSLTSAGADGNRAAGFVRAPQSGNFYLVGEEEAYSLGRDPYEVVEKIDRILAPSIPVDPDGEMTTFSGASEPALQRGMGWMEESVREAGGKFIVGEFGHVSARFPAHVQAFRMGCFALSGGPALSLGNTFGAGIRFAGEDVSGRACDGRLWLPRVDLAYMGNEDGEDAPHARPFGFSSYVNREVDIRLDAAGAKAREGRRADDDGVELGFILYGEGRTGQTYIRIKSACGDDGRGYYAPPKKRALGIEGGFERDGTSEGMKEPARGPGFSHLASESWPAAKKMDRNSHVVAFGQLDYAGRLYKPYFGMQVRMRP